MTKNGGNIMSPLQAMLRIVSGGTKRS